MRKILNQKKSRFLLGLMIFISQISLAQIQFEAHAIENTGCNYKVAPSDIDGDGDMDYFAICFSSMADLNHVTWYENTNGLGEFMIKDILSTEEEAPTRIYPCDINGDGDQDLLSCSRGQGGIDRKIFWFENLDGQGNFGSRQIIDVTAETTWSLQANDIDGDGDIDVVAAVNEEKIAWYENTDGEGSFGEAKIIVNLFSDVYDINVSDIDNDGDMDVLAAFTDVINANSEDNRIVWYENIDGEGNFGDENIVTLEVNVPSDLHTNDFDNDGDMDVLTCTLLGGEIAWYENLTGQGDLFKKRLILEDEIGVSDLAMADLDNDGDLDVLSTTREWNSFPDNKVSWYENKNGLGVFGEQQVLYSDLYIPASIGVADFDGDLDVDIICKSGSYSSNAAITYWFENLSSVGIREYTLTDFTIYPTLVNDQLIVKSEKEMESIEIYNAVGQLLLTEFYPNQVDVSSLVDGTYFCVVKDGDNNFGIKKIIKQSR